MPSHASLSKKKVVLTNYCQIFRTTIDIQCYWASVRGVHAPCSFYNFPACSLLLSIFCPLLLFRFFPAPFPFFCAPCSFLIFPLAPCSFFQIFHCSMLLFTIFGAPCSRITLVCSLLLYLFYGLLLAPLCQIGLAPCSGITPKGGLQMQFWWKQKTNPINRGDYCG